MNEKHNSKITKRSQQLRKEMTAEEKKLWYQFLKKLPFTVHRQKVIGNYIADFYCVKAALVIELDGTQHFETDGQKADVERDVVGDYRIALLQSTDKSRVFPCV